LRERRPGRVVPGAAAVPAGWAGFACWPAHRRAEASPPTGCRRRRVRSADRAVPRPSRPGVPGRATR